MSEIGLNRPPNGPDAPLAMHTELYGAILGVLLRHVHPLDPTEIAGAIVSIGHEVRWPRKLPTQVLAELERMGPGREPPLFDRVPKGQDASQPGWVVSAQFLDWLCRRSTGGSNHQSLEIPPCPANS